MGTRLRRIGFTKGLEEELADKVSRVNDLITDITTILDTDAFNDKYVGARAFKLHDILNVKYTDTVTVASVLNTEEFDTKFISAREVKQIKDAVDAAATGLVFKGSFDIGTETELPTTFKTGDFYKVINSVDSAASVDIAGINFTQGDSVYRGATEWIPIDNTESADILRTGNLSTEADWTVDPDKLSNRATTKIFVESMLAASAVKRKKDIVSITGDDATLSFAPLSDVIDTAAGSVDNGDGTFDVVDVSCVGTTLTVNPSTPGQYDGKSIIVTYTYI